MKFNTLVAVSGFSSGNIEVYGDGVRMTISLTSAQLAKLSELAKEFYLDHQASLIEQATEIPPSNRLAAPEPAPEYTHFEPVRADLDDDVPF